jgi:hypothetical protein
MFKTAIKNKTTSTPLSLISEIVDKEMRKIKVKELITSFEAACKDQHLNPDDLIFVNPKNKYQVSANAFTKLKVIIKSFCLAYEWEANLGDSSQYKYLPYFIQHPSGVGLSFHAYGCWNTNSACGVRFCLPTRELAEYIGRTFIKLYEEMDEELVMLKTHE